MRVFRPLLVFLCLIIASFGLSAQNPIQKLTLRLDSSAYSWPTHNIEYQDREVLPIVISANAPAIEIQLSPINLEGVKNISFLPQSDFSPIDSLVVFQNEFLLGKLKLKNILDPGVKNIAFRMFSKQGDSINLIFPVLPTIPANISIPPKNYLFLVGEVSQIPLLTDFPDNIKSFSTWKRNARYAYRITKKEGQNFLEIIPFESGEFEVRLSIECKFPHLIGSRVNFYQRLEPFEFEAKRGSLKFLDLGLDDLFLGRNEKNINRSISFNRPLELDVKKRYRLEAGEEPGSKLIAELWTQKFLSGGQIQGIFTVYDYHNREDGPLYVKNGSKAIFQTNVNIIPKPTVSSLADGSTQKSWTARPGETIKISWIGESLDRANWSLKGPKNQIELQKAEVSSEKASFEITIPRNIQDKKLDLILNGKPTGYFLEVKEWERPQEFGYVSLGFPERTTRMYGNKMIKRPYYFDQLEDTDISIHTAQIEKEKLLFGLQYLNMDFTLYDPEGRVLERKRYSHIAIRPGKHSPRHKFYSAQSWSDTTLKLENIFTYPIEEAPAWSKIQIDIAHDTARYDTGVQKIQFNLILRKEVEFNVELAIPVGIISNHPEHVNGTRIDGASIFLMGQVGFYQRNKINKLQKFRVGAGVVALNALNLRRSNRVDLGLGSMLQFYPTSQNSKLSVPLYAGGGYAITRNYWFFYSGAGVAVRLD